MPRLRQLASVCSGICNRSETCAALRSSGSILEPFNRKTRNPFVQLLIAEPAQIAAVKPDNLQQGAVLTEGPDAIAILQAPRTCAPDHDAERFVWRFVSCGEQETCRRAGLFASERELSRPQL